MITPEVRLTYVTVDEPKANLSGALKYSVGMLIPKTNTEMIGWFKGAIKNAIDKGIQKGKFNKAGSESAKFKNPFRDGDAYYEEATTEEQKAARISYRGHYFVNATSDNKPGLVDRFAKPLMQQGEVYSGCYALVDCNFYPFNAAGSIGIGCGLNNIMKKRDGERLDGRSPDASVVFAGVAEKDEGDLQ